MADREPTRNDSGQAPASGDDWLGTESTDSVESVTFGFDFDLNSAINETLASVTPAGSALPAFPRHLGRTGWL